MTAHQQDCPNRYEEELRPGLPPLDRNVELDATVLADRVRLMQDFFYLSHWPKDKTYAAAICYLCFFGYDPDEERAIAERIKVPDDGSTKQ